MPWQRASFSILPLLLPLLLLPALLFPALLFPALLFPSLLFLLFPSLLVLSLLLPSLPQPLSPFLLPPVPPLQPFLQLPYLTRQLPITLLRPNHRRYQVLSRSLCSPQTVAVQRC
ncbi:hypothetical protein R3P38DRAFT_282733 [Favolaschia claudopus]|uniref:Uncharacterized protein n=1 Tax=Favolaschia claudopus TaxID=2862362 RepID=A0AAV9ZNW2_9AGAR